MKMKEKKNGGRLQLSFAPARIRGFVYFEREFNKKKKKTRNTEFFQFEFFRLFFRSPLKMEIFLFLLERRKKRRPRTTKKLKEMKQEERKKKLKSGLEG